MTRCRFPRALVAPIAHRLASILGAPRPRRSTTDPGSSQWSRLEALEPRVLLSATIGPIALDPPLHPAPLVAPPGVPSAASSNAQADPNTAGGGAAVDPGFDIDTRAIWIFGDERDRMLMLPRLGETVSDLLLLDRREQRLRFLLESGIDTVYLLVGNEVEDDTLAHREAEFATLITRMRDYGLTVHGTIGTPGLDLSLNGVITDVLGHLITYNQNMVTAGRPEAQFDGVILDVEPWVRDDWNANRHAISQDLLDVSQEVTDRRDTQAPSLPVGMAIPLWFDTFDVSWSDSGPQETQDMNRHVQEIFDYVAVSAYRHTACGEALDCDNLGNGMIFQVLNEMAYAIEVQKPIVLGVETRPGQGDIVTFFEEGDVWLQQQLEIVRDAFDTNPYFTGFAIHQMEVYYDWSGIILETEAVAAPVDPLVGPPQHSIDIPEPWTHLSNVFADGYRGEDRLSFFSNGTDDQPITFTPDLHQAGTYRVMLNWVAQANQPANLRIDIHHANGTFTQFIDQRQQGATVLDTDELLACSAALREQCSNHWIDLGAFDFVQGAVGSVVVHTLGARGRVVVDALRFRRINPNAIESIILDNTDIKEEEDLTGVELFGPWAVSNVFGGFHGQDYLLNNNSEHGDKRVEFTPDITVAGQYDVFVRWTSNPERSTRVPIDIHHATPGSGPAPEPDTFIVDQTQSGGRWVQLGSYFFDTDLSGKVVVRTDNTEDGLVAVDAVRFDRLTPPAAAPSASSLSNPDPTGDTTEGDPGDETGGVDLVEWLGRLDGARRQPIILVPMSPSGLVDLAAPAIATASTQETGSYQGRLDGLRRQRRAAYFLNRHLATSDAEHVTRVIPMAFSAALRGLEFVADPTDLPSPDDILRTLID